MAGRWADTGPAQLAGWFAACPVPWWVAGGWALDLWLGRQTRPHSDIEAGCFRGDLPALAGLFGDWDVRIARNKQLTPYDLASPPPDPPFSLWLRRRGSAVWDFEVLVEERIGDRWVYRRDRRVSLPLARLTVPDANGACRLIAPQVQLLYKAPAMREKDAADFEAVRPQLSAAARGWLKRALTDAHPGHVWIARL